ncbi:Acylphosphatase-1 [Dactylella cylindrospora]|nr:Acylphosphatase-1 [Dactylella cylindrospora]
MSIKRYTFTVHGQVQGVFFRKFTQQSANDLSLVGYVRNTVSGTVAGEAQGTEESLEKFKEKLHEGSPRSSVTKVDWSEVEVRKDGEGQGPGGLKGFDRFMVTR